MVSDFRILGELQVLQDGHPVDLGSPRQRALLARLLVAGAGVTTDRLLEDLWPEDAPEPARHALHVYVSRLRGALGADGARLQRQGSGYRLTVATDELDASRFEGLAGEGRAARTRGDPETASTRLEAALDMWRGPALTEFADEPFAREEAGRLEELRLTALEDRLWADLELGRDGELVDELDGLVSEHPFREAFVEQLMLVLYRSGRQADALRVYQTERATLAEELGIDPGPALRGMEERILRQDPSLGTTSGEAPSSRPDQLPLQRTSFMGRQRELTLGAKLLARTRLLTLTGAPGIGKTRLALRLAADHQSEFPHGSVFVPLAAVSDSRFVIDAIARTLGLRETKDESPLDVVKAHLRERYLLLLLDNFEHVIGAAAQVGELLDVAPDLKILITSRSRLGLSGEQEYPVPSLGLPPLDPALSAETLRSYDAVGLFLTRARATDPGFDLDAGNAAAIAGITLRLDGLPLAIELAAARVRLLPPQELLGRLERSLNLLTGGPADAEERHRTMRDAIAWSYDLLEPEERSLFRRLGVFRGGFTLEAATRVAERPDAEIVEGVDSLLAKSLLYRPVDIGRARFSMLETMREFAVAELASAGEGQEISARHARSRGPTPRRGYGQSPSCPPPCRRGRRPGPWPRSGRLDLALLAELRPARGGQALAGALAGDRRGIGRGKGQGLHSGRGTGLLARRLRVSAGGLHASSRSLSSHRRPIRGS